MFTFIFALVALASLSLAQRASWGPNIHMRAKSEIVYFSGTLIPGNTPAERSFTAIWPGLWSERTAKYDLVQTVTSVHDRAYMQSLCGAKKGQWCTQVYVLRTMKPVTKPKGHALSPNDQLFIEYERRNKQWFQQIKRNGKMLDSLSAGDLPARTFALQTEMQKSGAGTIADQVYANITLKLAQAEPGFGKTLSKAGRVTLDNPRTSDGGKTWHINRVVLGSMSKDKA